MDGLNDQRATLKLSGRRSFLAAGAQALKQRRGNRTAVRNRQCNSGIEQGEQALQPWCAWKACWGTPLLFLWVENASWRFALRCVAAAATVETVRGPTLTG